MKSLLLADNKCRKPRRRIPTSGGMGSWVLALCLCLVVMGTAFGDGADDIFVGVYNLIQNADGHREQGRLSEARDAYSRADRDLRHLQKAFPNWNERVVNYRLRYLADRLEALKIVPATQPAATSTPPPSETPAPEPTGEVMTELKNLNVHIQRLTSEKQVLEARLREALSAQPAPVDPRELQRAVERITQLQQTNQTLLATLEQQQADRKNLVERVVAEEAQRALNDANRQLMAQKTAAAGLQKEKADLETELKKLQEVEVKNLRSENSALKSQVSELRTDTERGRQIAELSGRLSRLQGQLDESKKQNQTLQSEKSALEMQLNDSQLRKSEESIVRVAKLESDLALAKADAGRLAGRAEDLVAALEKERAARQKTEAQNSALTQRVSELAQGDAKAADAVRTLQSALTAEKDQRSRLESDLRAAEKKFAELAAQKSVPPPPPPTAIPSPAAPATELENRLGAMGKELASLRSALKESRDREAELSVTIAEEATWRKRLTAEKQELEQRLNALLAGASQANPAGSVPVPPASVLTLELKVRNLERQKDELTRRLAQAGVRATDRMNQIKRQHLTPREAAADARLRR